MRWRHQVDLPDAVRDALELSGGERMLAAAAMAEPGAEPATGPQPAGFVDAGAADPTGYAIATDAALHVPAVEQPVSPAADRRPSFRRLAYDSILRVSWDADTSTLSVVLPEPAGGHLELPLADPGYLPETVRERVQNTILYSQHVPLQGTKGVLISARRRPGDADARWTLAYDIGLDGSDPALRERAERAVGELRARTGI